LLVLFGISEFGHLNLFRISCFEFRIYPMICVGNAPCSWGTLEFEGMDSQPLSSRQMLDELAETGYTGTELGDWGFMPTEPSALKRELTQRSLDMLGAFVPVAFKDAHAHAAGEAHALKVARLLAAVSEVNPQGVKPFVVLSDANGTDPVRTQNAGRVISEMGLRENEWRVFAQGVERIARAVQTETGLRAVYHHHCAGYVETPGEIARLLELTDPHLVGLVFDTGHYAFGAGSVDGREGLEGLERFADRIWYAHFKDCQPNIARLARVAGWDYFAAVERGVFCELGQGCVDFSAVVGWLRARGYQGYIVVEQDVLPGMGTPKESAKRNRDYLRRIGLE
jgi:inosose dehydratase